MVQRAKRRMRCEECGGFQTRKAGGRTISPVSMSRRTTRRIQRYHCRGCGKYFTKRREPRKKYTFHFKGELVRMHVEERLSCRVIAKRIQERLGKRIHPSVVNRMINEVAARTKSSVEMKLQYQPHWSGYVTVDDKWVNVRGRQRVSLLAVDSLGDPLHSELGREPTQEMYDQFLLYVRDRLRYRFRAITTDLDGRLERAIRRVLGPQIAHQKCLWHALEIVKGLIDYPQTARQYRRFSMQLRELEERLADRKQSLYVSSERFEAMRLQQWRWKEVLEEKQAVVEAVRAIVYARERHRSERLREEFQQRSGRQYPAVVRFLWMHWEGLLQHQRDEKIPKTTARAENINTQLQRRYKTIDAFQSEETAFNYQNLLRSYLRFKPYTDCRGKNRSRNGKSPLELCHAKITTPDWVKNAVRYP